MCDRIYVMNEGRFVAEFAARRGQPGKDHARHRPRGPCNDNRSRPAPSWPKPPPAAGPTRLPEGPPARLRMLLSLVAIMAFFQYMTGGTLLQPLNLTNLVLQNSYIVIMALGMLLVIVAGHIDLSVGSVCGFIGALAAVLMVHSTGTSCRPRWSAWWRARAIGGAQGWFVAYMRIPSFIVTLAGMLVFKGLALLAAAGPVGRAVPAGVPAAVHRLHARSAGRRLAAPHLAAARRAGRGGAGLLQAARAQAGGEARHGGRAAALLPARTWCSSR
jgi:hypothetical protein